MFISKTRLVLRQSVTVLRLISDGYSNVNNTNNVNEMDLRQVTKKLKSFAPTSLAGSWDNVGLLIEPTPPHQVTSMLLTNDLSETVMEEALSKQVNMILSYHPPIFMPLKQLTQSQWKERIVIKCIENRIALYSPHTTYDAVKGGVSDWLISPFEGKICVIEQQKATDYPTGGGYRLEFTIPADDKSLEQSLCSIPNVHLVTEISISDDRRRLYYNCSEKSLVKAVQVVNSVEDVRVTMEIFQCSKPPLPNNGQGRTCMLNPTSTVEEVINKIKGHLNLKHVRLALAVGASLDSKVKSIAVCAGSGGSVLRAVKLDLWLTGEMSHHEILDANHRGTTVILCDHSNTERGYLTVLKQKFTDLFNNEIAIHISETDKDPLDIV